MCIKDQLWLSKDKEISRVLSTDCTDLEDIATLYNV